MSTPDTAPSFIHESLRTFAIALPILYFVRFAGKWVMADSSEAFRTWFAAEWPAELVIGLAGAIVFGLAGGYREWSDYWDSVGKRDDRYEP